MKLLDSIKEIIDSGQYTNSTVRGGKWVKKFENQLSKYLNKPTICVNSGTSALIISLKMAGVKAGDEVIIPAYGFIATKNAVLALQAKPVYADINPDTFCMDIKNMRWRELLSTKTEAIIITDLYGNICDLPDTMMPIIEDACQALGTIKECRADYTCFSFYPTKIVNAMEGGAISCDDPWGVRKLRTYPDGINMRMGEINACIGYHNFIRKISEKPRKDEKFLGKPENWYKHYDYTLSPEGECPNADYAKNNPLKFS